MINEFGYEYDTVLDSILWEQDKGCSVDSMLFGAYCLRSGRDAIKAIAREFRTGIVYLPALICNTVITPFLLWDYEIRFYKLNKDYSINIEDIEVDQKDKTVLFFYMNYFGIQSICDIELEKLRIRYNNIVFIEDRTHSLIWKKESGFMPDYTIVSIRKWLDIPDGGLLWGKISYGFENDTTFSEKRLKAQCMRHEYLKNCDESLKAVYRKEFYELYKLLDSDKTPCSMSMYSFHKICNTNWDDIKKKRLQNGETLVSILEKCPCIRIIQANTFLSGLYVPFLVDNRDIIQERLSSIGIFNTIIWPITEEQKDVCNIARYTAEHMLAAPCDQRYGLEDMKYIGKEVIRIVEDTNGIGTPLNDMQK